MLSQLWSKTLRVCPGSDLLSSWSLKIAHQHQTINYIQFPELIKSLFNKDIPSLTAVDYHFIMFTWSTVFCQYPSDFAVRPYWWIKQIVMRTCNTASFKTLISAFLHGTWHWCWFIIFLGRGGRFRDFHLAFPHQDDSHSSETRNHCDSSAS